MKKRETIFKQMVTAIYYDDPYEAWGMERPEPGEDDPFEAPYDD